MPNSVKTPKAHAPYETKVFLGGPHRLYKFENGYGASVVEHIGSYGLVLTVLKWDDNASDSETPPTFKLNYDTPITKDVVGYNTEETVQELLTQIKALSKDGKTVTTKVTDKERAAASKKEK